MSRYNWYPFLHLMAPVVVTFQNYFFMYGPVLNDNIQSQIIDPT